MSQRVRFIKSYENYRQGEVKVIDNNVAHSLIERGIVVLSKDMVQTDYSTKKPLKRTRRAKNGKTNNR